MNTNEDFKSKLIEYKKLKKNNYEPKINTYVTIDSLLLWSPTIIAMMLLWITGSQEIGLVSVVMLLSTFIIHYGMYIVTNTSGLIERKYNKFYKLEKYFSKSLFRGDIGELFDYDCPVTRKILNDKKEFIMKEISQKRSLSGNTVMLLTDKIFKEKEDLQRIEDFMHLKSTNTAQMLSSMSLIENE